MKPKSVNVLGIQYTIEYFDSPSEVDIYKRKSLWGQCDYWTRAIRIFDDGNRPLEDIWSTIFHEVLHAIEAALHLECFKINGAEIDDLDLLALALADIFFRNEWIMISGEESDND